MILSAPIFSRIYVLMPAILKAAEETRREDTHKAHGPSGQLLFVRPNQGSPARIQPLDARSFDVDGRVL